MSGTADQVGTVLSLWRYPVKSMQGEELDAADVTARGVLGDRQFALVDRSTGRVVSAKNPRKWPGFFDFRAGFVEAPRPEAAIPPVRITFPDGSTATSGQDDLAELLSASIGRDVAFSESSASRGAQAEEYWPDMEGLDHRDTVTEFELPEGTFFDAAVVHVLTTATLERLGQLYPEGRFEVPRFRPNVVVSVEGEGFVENGWAGRTVAIGDEVRLRVTEPCPRCVMTTLPQRDLPKDPGILRTAAQHNGANVGMYAAVEQGGLARRGDPVRLL